MNFSELKSLGLFNGLPYLTPTQTNSPELIRQHVIQGTPLERVAFIDEITIGTPTFIETFCLLESLVQLSGSLKAPGGGYLSADGGMGKTFIATRLQKRFPPCIEDGKYIHPILHVVLRERPNVNSVHSQILEQLKQFKPTRCPSKEQGLDPYDRVAEACKASSVRLILIDEAHHMWGKNSSRRHADRKAGPVGEWAKTFYDKTDIPIFFLGKEGIADLFAADDQSETRWPIKMCLNHYQDEPLFEALLNGFDSALPMLEKAGLGEEMIRPLIYKSVAGNLRKLRDLLKRAVFIAAQTGSTRITKEHLRTAHFMQFGSSQNPF